MLRINAISIEVMTENGKYGYSTEFSNSLNIVRGDNTSGKSTLLNTLFYSLGMEELLGGRNEDVLPYAVRTHLVDPVQSSSFRIMSSEVLAQVENKSGERITLRRSIVSEKRNSKLIEVIQGPFLTSGEGNYRVLPTYIHDPGSAQSVEAGFFRFLESFMGFDLPLVPNNQGGVTKLYLQTIFAGLLIEQKSGWTNYLANIPFFRIKNSEQKVVEFLMKFDVFRNEQARSELNLAINNIKQSWKDSVSVLKNAAINLNFRVKAMPLEIDESYRSELVIVDIDDGEREVDIGSHLENLYKQLKDLSDQTMARQVSEVPSEGIERYERSIEEANRLSLLLREVENGIWTTSQSLKDLGNSLVGLKKEVEKNKAVLKVRRLGFEIDIQVSHDLCPTCHQHISDSLIQSDDQYVMSVEENLAYLGSQIKMIDFQIAAKREELQRSNVKRERIKKSIEEQSGLLRALRTNIITGERDSIEEVIRRKITVESSISALHNFLARLEETKAGLADNVVEYLKYKKELLALPAEYLSKADLAKLKKFQSEFLKYAEEFEYTSTSVENIILDEEKYLPYMKGVVSSVDLRNSIILETVRGAKIKSDSSASDFVRLIWAYLIALFSASKVTEGNHPGILLFDEPAQHSMAVSSLRRLLTNLSGQENLQSIVGASFDESDEVFNTATQGITYKYIQITNKLLSPIGPANAGSHED